MRRSLLLAAVLFGSYAFFYQGGGWNQNAHFAQVRALVEEHVLHIDSYAGSTGDTSSWGGHVYSNKAPGTAIFAAPVVALVRMAAGTAGVNTADERFVIALSYVATLTASAMPTAIGGWCLFWLCRLSGVNDAGAAVATIAFGLGTPQWAYATLLYSHALAGASLLAGCLAALLIRTAKPDNCWKLAATAGLCAGWAVLSEYPSLPPAGFIATLALISSSQRDDAKPAAALLAVLAGAAGPALLLLAFDWLAFGSPFQISYASADRFEQLHQGFFGITFPSRWQAFELLFGHWRGLLPVAPALAVAPAGFWWLVRERASRPTALVAGAIVTSYFVLISSFAYWSGGVCYGPRLLGASLGFWALGLGPLWMHSTRLGRVLILSLTLVGVALSAVAVSTTPQPPEEYRQPVTQLLLPLFRSDQLAANWATIFDLNSARLQDKIGSTAPPTAWNVGLLLGLRGRLSLLPLVALWGIAAALWHRPETRRLALRP